MCHHCDDFAYLCSFNIEVFFFNITRCIVAKAFVFYDDNVETMRKSWVAALLPAWNLTGINVGDFRRISLRVEAAFSRLLKFFRIVIDCPSQKSRKYRAFWGCYFFTDKWIFFFCHLPACLMRLLPIYFFFEIKIVCNNIILLIDVGPSNKIGFVGNIFQ